MLAIPRRRIRTGLDKPAYPVRWRADDDLARDLVAAWIFNEGAGPALDLTRRGLDESARDGAVWAQTRRGFGLSVNGNEHIEIANNARLNTPRASYAVILNPTNLTGFKVLLNYGGADRVSLHTSGSTFVTYVNNNSLATASLLTVNTPVHLCSTYDGTTHKLYIDGRFRVEEAPGVGDLGTTTAIMYIGEAVAGGSGVIGVFDSVWVWSEALTPAQVFEHWRNPYGLCEPLQRRVWVPVAAAGGGGAVIPIFMAQYRQRAA